MRLFLTVICSSILAAPTANAYAFFTRCAIKPSFNGGRSFLKRLEIRNQNRHVFHCSPLLMGKPKSGSIVDRYQTVSVNCKKCRTRLFRYKKKNGTKSNLIKCYIERISEDCVDLVANKTENEMSENGNGNGSSANGETDWFCPNCDTRFGKDSMIHGRPAIKLVGGKTTMTKK